ncbi:hypothetical protein V1291_003994 [Nitrobacteraceae bacterium AZCC 1564]
MLVKRGGGRVPLYRDEGLGAVRVFHSAKEWKEFLKVHPRNNALTLILRALLLSKLRSPETEQGIIGGSLWFALRSGRRQSRSVVGAREVAKRHLLFMS